MKKYIFPIILLSVAGFYTLKENNPHIQRNQYAAIVNSGGAPSGKTGAPGEGNCTMCHSGSVNDGNATSSVSFSGANNEYELGVTYDLTLSISNGSSKNGFQLVVLDSAQGNDAGSLTASDIVNTQIAVNNRTYLNHTNSGNSLTSWNFQWTAPSNDIGPITLYYSYNVSNAMNNTGGDQIYLASHTIYPSTSTGLYSVNATENGCFVVGNKLILPQNPLMSEVATISFYSIKGKRISSFKTTLNSGIDNEISLPVDFKRGLYILSISSGEYNQAIKFIH